MNYIYGACPEAHVFYGHAFDETLEDRIQITVIATGFPSVRAGVVNRRGMNRGRPGNGIERRIPVRAGAPSSEKLSDAPDGPGARHKNLEEELQRPAFLRKGHKPRSS